MAVNSLIPDRSATQDDPEPEVLDLQTGGDALSVLASETAREIFMALCDSPAPVSEIARRIETSLQNVEYHLERLEDADLVDTKAVRYSSKGNEMTVYGPASDPLVILAGGDTDLSTLTADRSQ